LEGLAGELWEEKGDTVVYRTPESGDDAVAFVSDKGAVVSYCLCYPEFAIFEQGYLSIHVSLKI
jgi:hypothetical protein